MNIIQNKQKTVVAATKEIKELKWQICYKVENGTTLKISVHSNEGEHLGSNEHELLKNIFGSLEPKNGKFESQDIESSQSDDEFNPQRPPDDPKGGVPAQSAINDMISKQEVTI